MLDGFAGGGHFSFRFGNRGSLTGSAFRFDLLFEIVEPPSRGFYGRVQTHILWCEPLLEVMQLLAQLRGAPLQICDGRVVPGGDEPLAAEAAFRTARSCPSAAARLLLAALRSAARPFAADSSWF